MATCFHCGSDELEANAHEAWCYDCGERWTLLDEPEQYNQIRDAVLEHRREVGQFLAGLIPTDEAAKIAGVKGHTLRAYARDGLAPEPTKIGSSLMWSRAEIEAWVANRPGQGARTDLHP